MKKSAKVVVTMLCAAMLVCASVMGTMAYLTSTKTVTNTFTLGANVTIDLDELDVDNDTLDSDNKSYSAKGGKTVVRDMANAYELFPGHTYTKDPTVHVTGGDCYVYITVKNEITSVEDTNNTIASQIIANGWKLVDGYTNLYVYCGTGATNRAVVNKDTVSNIADGLNENGTGNNGDLVVFKNFKIGDNVTSDGLNALKNDKTGVVDKTIEIKAFAVQKDGFETYADAVAFETAFKDNTDAVKNS